MAERINMTMDEALRDQLAMAALPALVNYSTENNYSIAETARQAYKIADAMMEARKEEEKDGK